MVSGRKKVNNFFYNINIKIFMNKKFTAGTVVLILVFLFAPNFAHAAPTLRQQITYADSLVKMGEKLNGSCGNLVRAYEAQVSGVTSTAEDSDVFGDYFSCAFASMASFYTDHWAPPASLKNFQAKTIKLGDGLAATMSHVTKISTTSAEFTAFKSLVAKNNTLIAGLKKDLAAIKKRYPAAAKNDAAFLKKINTQEKAQNGRGLLTGVKASCGKDAACFETKFAKCAAAWVRYPLSNYDLEFKIIGKVKGGCKVLVSEKMDYYGLLVGKQMNCVIDYKKEFSDELNGLIGQITGSSTKKICTGALFDYTKKQYKMFSTVMLDMIGANFAGSAYSNLNGDSGIDVSVKLDIGDTAASTTVPAITPAPALTCSDTDAGQNFLARGTVSGYLGDGHNTPAMVTDYCSNDMESGAESTTGAYVSEYYCTSGGYFGRAWNTCANGCSDGKCR
jgi:hypothetical protein